MSEELRRLLSQLEDDLSCQVALSKLDGDTIEEIAEKLDCSLRTVTRKLQLLRRIWSQETKQ